MFVGNAPVIGELGAENPEAEVEHRGRISVPRPRPWWESDSQDPVPKVSQHGKVVGRQLLHADRRAVGEDGEREAPSELTSHAPRCNQK